LMVHQQVVGLLIDQLSLFMEGKVSKRRLKRRDETV
jgi:hypothetical protein